MVTRVMGIVNVTPDSFSDGGRWLDPDAAAAHARRLLAEGAAIVDIGGESTRPGAAPVDEATELERVVPVVEAVADFVAALDVTADRPEVSIDTTKPAVARAAVAAGATIVNDVSASLEAVAAELGAGWVAMHAGGPSATMQDDPAYDDVVDEVGSFLADAVARGRAAGVDRIWVDPGIGFGKTTDHNLALLADLDAFTTLGAPLLVGASRKRTIGELHGRADGTGAAEADDRLEGSLAVAAWAAQLGADIVRVHDVEATMHVLRVAGEPRGTITRLETAA